MTPEEREMLGGLFQRVNAAAPDPARPRGRILHQRCGSRRAPRALCARADRPGSAASLGGGGESDRRTRGCGSPGRASRARNMGVSSAISARRFSAPDHPRRRRRPAMTSRPISGRRRPTRRNRRRVIARSRRGIPSSRRRVIPRSPGPGAPRRSRKAAASCRTQPRPRQASPAASRLAICLAACSAAIRAAASSAAAELARPDWAARACPAIRRKYEINNYYDGAKGDGGANADFQGFDPGAPGVQDANFDQLDDSSFDNSDGSSFDDSRAAASTTSEVLRRRNRDVR